MSERTRQIKEAASWLWTGLTGTKEEIREKAEELGKDVERQVKAHRRRLNAPVVDVEGEVEEDPKP